MRFRVVSSLEVAAAGGNLSARAYLSDLCDDCGHGKEQHKPLFRKVRTGECTSPDCHCKQYQQTGTQVYHGA